MDDTVGDMAELGGRRGTPYKSLYEELRNEISDYEQREELLERSESRFRLLYENSPLGYQSLDSEGCFLDVNPAWLDLLGYDRDEVIGRSFGELVIREELFAELFAEFKKSGEARWVDFQMIRKDGQLVDVEIDGKIVCNADGSFRQTHCILHDVSERKRLVRAVEAKNRELQSIVYVASHDLKSPLVNISGFGGEMKLHCAELIEMMGRVTVCDADRDRLDALLNAHIPESLGYINKATKKMHGLIDGLLQVSRVGNCEMVVHKIDMNKLIGEIVESLSFQTKEAGAEIIVEELVDCVGDATKTNQIFSNLIDNAIKYLDPERKGAIRISGRVECGQSLYCVEDNGIGIDAKYQNRVFELFYRFASDDSVSGEGLGLTIVRRIASRLGGRAWAESGSGHGSKFFVSLPNGQ